MLVSTNIAHIRQELATKINQKIALVPTMGALHQGHLSLINKAKEIAEIIVVSIFINKTQFNNAQDYQKYPKTLDNDLKLLKELGVNYVFTPRDDEIFSDDFSFKLSENNLSNCLCGSSRAGHFDGVSLILTKLFNIIKPNIAIFGQKDFQQLIIVKKLVKDLNFDIEIESCPTIRNENGLALSSRNQRLSPPNLIKAANIFKILSQIKDQIKKSPQKVENILQTNYNCLLDNGFDKIDYLEVRQENNLKLVKYFDKTQKSRIFIALHLENIRLIDNLAL